ncbi:hypothetical protein ACHAXS_008212 [Conticribra weissflogii]
MSKESGLISNPPPYNPEFRKPLEAEVLDYQTQFGQGEDVNAPGFQNDSRNCRATRREVGGAAALGTVAGLAVAGPIVGIVAGTGAAAVATSHSGPVGGHTRRAGESVARVGDRVKEVDKKYSVSERSLKLAKDVALKSKEIDGKYQLVDKSKRAVYEAKQKAKEVDEKHHLAEKSKTAVRSVAEKAKQINEKHQVSEKSKKAATTTWNKTVAGARFVSSKINKKNSGGPVDII